MKLTDEAVARALGWRKVHAKRQWGGRQTMVWENGDVEIPKLPAFTSSVDAITAAIEEMGLYWDLRRTGSPLYRAFMHPGSPDKKWTACRAEKHPALALAESLLAYLKEQPKGGTK